MRGRVPPAVAAAAALLAACGGGEDAGGSDAPEPPARVAADVPGLAVDSVSIRYDSLLPAGEIPPPERRWAADLDAARRAAMRLSAPCRFVHGTIGDDADFEVCLPEEGWNGKLAIWAPGGAGSEFQGSAVLRPVALVQGYAYASTDLGFSLSTLDEPGNRVAEGERRALQLTRYARHLAGGYYGDRHVRRVYVAGHSYGGYLATRLLERAPELYEGGIRHAGTNSLYQSLRAMGIWLRHHGERPVNPVMYDVGARLPDGTGYRLGQERGTEELWEGAAPGWRTTLAAFLPAVDPGYDPDGDGRLSDAQLDAWDADARPAEVGAGLRELAVTGDLQDPMILYSGLADVFSPPSSERSYRALAKERVGAGRVALYLEPGVDHQHGFPVPLDPEGRPTGFWPEALAALDAWVDEGRQPGPVAGLERR